MTITEVQKHDTTSDLRQEAIAWLRKKRDLQADVLAFILVNLFLNAIWLLTTPGGFYWPMFPLLGWGIGLAFHVWDVYVGSNPSEKSIRAEMNRMSRR